MASGGISIRVRESGSNGSYCVVEWRKGSSLESINQSIATALKHPRDSTIIAKDSNDNVVCISDSIPDKMKLEVEALDGRGHHHTSTGYNPIAALGNLLGMGSPDREHTRRAHFRGTVLKLENVQAHLANERTWLAWARTALSALTVSFSLLSLADDADSNWLSISLFVVGCLMVFNVLFTFVTGWLRYVKIKDVLLLSKSDVSENFNRFGISHHARLLILLLFLISAFYIAGSSDLASS